MIGHVFVADFGEKAFTLQYQAIDKLILTEIKGQTVGRKQELRVKVVELRPWLFMVNWQEATKLTVTDIEDYEKSVVYAKCQFCSVEWKFEGGLTALNSLALVLVVSDFFSSKQQR